MILLWREIIVWNPFNDRAEYGGLRDIAAGRSVGFLDNQSMMVIRIFCNTGSFQSLRIQQDKMTAERRENDGFIWYNRIHIMPGKRSDDALQYTGKPHSIPAESSDHGGILVLFSIGFQFLLNLLDHTVGGVSLRIGYNMAKAARAVLQHSLRMMQMCVSKSGDHALPLAVNDLCGIPNPLSGTCLISNVCEFAVFDNKCLRMRFCSIQCNGINFCVPINFVCCLFHCFAALFDDLYSVML